MTSTAIYKELYALKKLLKKWVIMLPIVDLPLWATNPKTKPSKRIENAPPTGDIKFVASRPWKYHPSFGLFSNKIRDDLTINECISKLIKEFVVKKSGYELAIKSHIYWLLTLLFRNHKEEVLTQKKYEIRSKNLERFNKILKYIEDNYAEKLAIDNLARNANMSTSNFCHLFKKMTCKTLIEYVNNLRINNAENLLRNTDMNISEVAMVVGFNDINYFSRIFKKYKKIAPNTLKNTMKMP